VALGRGRPLPRSPAALRRPLFSLAPGVNPFALARAAGQWAINGRIVSGGSTITMQVARILEPTPRSLTGKGRQILRALQLEARLSKDEILTLYLNHAPMGGVLEGSRPPAAPTSASPPAA
jgi:penicillin-binding protein 1C